VCPSCAASLFIMTPDCALGCVCATVPVPSVYELYCDYVLKNPFHEMDQVKLINGCRPCWCRRPGLVDISKLRWRQHSCNPRAPSAAATAGHQERAV
jgi:hypothetical protein